MEFCKSRHNARHGTPCMHALMRHALCRFRLVGTNDLVDYGSQGMSRRSWRTPCHRLRRGRRELRRIWQSWAQPAACSSKQGLAQATGEAGWKGMARWESPRRAELTAWSMLGGSDGRSPAAKSSLTKPVLWCAAGPPKSPGLEGSGFSLHACQADACSLTTTHLSCSCVSEGPSGLRFLFTIQARCCKC